MRLISLDHVTYSLSSSLLHIYRLSNPPEDRRGVLPPSDYAPMSKLVIDRISDCDFVISFSDDEGDDDDDNDDNDDNDDDNDNDDDDDEDDTVVDDDDDDEDDNNDDEDNGNDDDTIGGIEESSSDLAVTSAVIDDKGSARRKAAVERDAASDVIVGFSGIFEDTLAFRQRRRIEQGIIGIGSSVVDDTRPVGISAEELCSASISQEKGVGDDKKTKGDIISAAWNATVSMQGDKGDYKNLDSFRLYLYSRDARLSGNCVISGTVIQIFFVQKYRQLVVLSSGTL